MQEKRDSYLVHQYKSFNWATGGVIYSFTKGTHLKIETAAAIIAIILGFIYSISSSEWLVLVLIISAILSAETMNTAVEEACDVLHPEHHPGARLAKHCAAGAVLILSIAALVIGAVIFVPKIIG